MVKVRGERGQPAAAGRPPLLPPGPALAGGQTLLPKELRLAVLKAGVASPRRFCRRSTAGDLPPSTIGCTKATWPRTAAMPSKSPARRAPSILLEDLSPTSSWLNVAWRRRAAGALEQDQAAAGAHGAGPNCLSGSDRTSLDERRARRISPATIGGSGRHVAELVVGSGGGADRRRVERSGRGQAALEAPHAINGSRYGDRARCPGVASRRLRQRPQARPGAAQCRRPPTHGASRAESARHGQRQPSRCRQRPPACIGGPARSGCDQLSSGGFVGAPRGPAPVQWCSSG